MGKQGKRIFGIDLGTTYSSAAYVDEFGKAVIIPNAENERITPSVVFFDGDAVVVGDVAKESAKLYPNEVVSFVKRSMGEPNFVFEYNNEEYRAEELSAYILKKLAQDAAQYLGETVEDVVITCPAYFGINEREATRKAGEIAGFNVRQIINEPTAAAIAYGTLDTTDNRVVLVYDLGGGTFDITMIDIRKDSVEVVCTGGDHNLGGKDWDDRIVTYMVEK
ncbi:MAG: Hsp70 family protein, partial [Desulfosalsimonadaceae bacterium]